MSMPRVNRPAVRPLLPQSYMDVRNVHMTVIDGVVLVENGAFGPRK